MKFLLIIIASLFIVSCVPVKFAPTIENYKVTKGKRFQKKLPKQNTFIFNDPKKAGEFYQFVESKLGSESEQLEYYTPFTINNNSYFFSYYEVERTAKTINLIPILFDASRNNKGKNTILEDFHTSKRTGTWYIGITVHSTNSTDCLKPDYQNQQEVITYLENLKNEYLNTSNYLETLMIRK